MILKLYIKLLVNIEYLVLDLFPSINIKSLFLRVIPQSLNIPFNSYNYFLYTSLLYDTDFVSYFIISCKFIFNIGVFLFTKFNFLDIYFMSFYFYSIPISYLCFGFEYKYIFGN